MFPQNFTSLTTTGNITLHEQSVTYHVQVSATIRLPTGIRRETQLSQIDDANTVFVPLPGKNHYVNGWQCLLELDRTIARFTCTRVCCPLPSNHVTGLPAPENVEVANISNSSVSLSWSIPPPPRDEILKFQVKRQLENLLRARPYNELQHKLMQS